MQLAAVGGAGLDDVVVAVAVALAPCNHHRVKSGSSMTAVACLHLWLKHASKFFELFFKFIKCLLHLINDTHTFFGMYGVALANAQQMLPGLQVTLLGVEPKNMPVGTKI